jgi:hypothetical protein
MNPYKGFHIGHNSLGYYAYLAEDVGVAFPRYLLGDLSLGKWTSENNGYKPSIEEIHKAIDLSINPIQLGGE